MNRNFLYFSAITLITIQFSYAQQTGLRSKNESDLKHFSIASAIPFENDCSNIADGKVRIKCLEDNLRNHVIQIIGADTEYDGEMHLYFTVNKKGNPTDIIAKGYPSDPDLQSRLEDAVLKLDLKPGRFRGRKANIRCYTRVFPSSIK